MFTSKLCFKENVLWRINIDNYITKAQIYGKRKYILIIMQSKLDKNVINESEINNILFFNYFIFLYFSKSKDFYICINSSQLAL